jgi:hypothetical protein
LRAGKRGEGGRSGGRPWEKIAGRDKLCPYIGKTTAKMAALQAEQARELHDIMRGFTHAK